MGENVRIHTHTHIHTHACTYTHIHTHTDTSTTHAHTYTHTHHTYTPHTHMYTHAHTQESLHEVPEGHCFEKSTKLPVFLIGSNFLFTKSFLTIVFLGVTEFLVAPYLANEIRALFNTNNIVKKNHANIKLQPI